MKHLSETDLIDLLMDEPVQQSVRDHIVECDPCQTKLDLIRDGLTVAKHAEPRHMPVMGAPIRYGRFRKNLVRTRILQAVAAVFVIFSVLGFRFESRPDGVMVQFSLLQPFVNQGPAREERLDALKDELMHMMQTQTEMAQHQMDARFNAMQIERDQELTELTYQLEHSVTTIDYNNALVLASMQENLAKNANLGRIK